MSDTEIELQPELQTELKMELAVFSDPMTAADEAGLVYVSDEEPGIRRVRRGKGFSYYTPDRQLIRDKEVLARIKALAIPPAWQDVWICLLPNGHLQATGRDARGRKTYLYHARWRERRNLAKYSRMLLFGAALPEVRSRVDADLSLRGLPREKVVATVVWLLGNTFIRIGNREYARANRSFGLTTLRNRHAEINGARVVLHFRGKSGMKHDIEIRNRRLARIIRQCRDVPGYELFQYIDEEGQRQAVRSEDVNTYLRKVTGQDFTAKDFRTWGGTVLAASYLNEIGPAGSQRAAKHNISHAIREVANHLGNRPATCRAYYVHPVIISAYLDGSLNEAFKESVRHNGTEPADGLEEEEIAVLDVLRQHLGEDQVNEP